MNLTIDDIKKYVPMQTSSFDPAGYTAFVNRAFYAYLPRYLGDKLITHLEGDTPEPALKERVAPVLANLAVMMASPFFNVVLTSTGFGIVRNNNIAPANMERVTAFIDSAQIAANDFLSILLAFLEKNKGEPPYTDWNRCSLNPGSLLPDTDTFNALTRLHLKHFQFVELKQNIQAIELTLFAETLSMPFLKEMQQENDLRVKPLLQQALGFMAYQEWLNDTDPEKSGNIFRSRGASFFARATSLLVKLLDQYPTYKKHGYEKPWDNADDDNVDSGFFVAGTIN